MLFFLREEGKGIFKTKLRVAVINGGTLRFRRLSTWGREAREDWLRPGGGGVGLTHLNARMRK